MKSNATIDQDMASVGIALRRAAARARQLAEETGTPLYVLKDGRVVDLNARRRGKLKGGVQTAKATKGKAKNLKSK